MLTFTLTQHSEDGKSAQPGQVHLGHHDKVYPIEIAAMWQSIANGQFEKQARDMLLKLCKEQRINCPELR